jgi:erythromycin esterase-like protein
LLLGLAGCGGAADVTSVDAAAAGRGRSQAPAPDAARTIAAAARPISGGVGDYGDIFPAMAGARRILLGESTHGTHEYYRERARLSERLIREAGVDGVAIEGDWGPTQRVNLYVRGLGSDTSAAQALSGYTRFPQWMWGNEEFRDFIERLRALNMERPAAQRVGVYGMDVYDLYDAADAVTAYLRETDRPAAERARAQYRCFAPYGRDTSRYGQSTQTGRSSCREEAEKVLAEVRRLPRPGSPEAAERWFGALRSAASVAAAEAYFRTAYAGSLAWNVRDQHMERNVEEIAGHLGALTGTPAKLVIWGHNTHSGDARATFAANRGELNLGQLMRQRHGEAAFLVGFFGHEGTVMAADEWDEPGKVFQMRPAMPGSYSHLFHSTGVPAFSLLLRGAREVSDALRGPMQERAIGVVYRPDTERLSHYFEARLSEQFDAAIFFNRSRAVTPLRR